MLSQGGSAIRQAATASQFIARTSTSGSSSKQALALVSSSSAATANSPRAISSSSISYPFVSCSSGSCSYIPAIQRDVSLGSSNTRTGKRISPTSRLLAGGSASTSPFARSRDGTRSAAAVAGAPGVMGAGYRCFHSSCGGGGLRARHKGHYEALDLPRNATKQQVKARFYELSKKHHPDAPGGSTAKFHEINDAYATLGDEAKRRQYDLSVSSPSSSSHHAHAHAHYSPHSPQYRGSASGPHRAWSRRTPPRDTPFNPFARANSNNNTSGSSASGSGFGYHKHDGPFGRSTEIPFGRRPRTGQRGGAGDDDGPRGGESGVWRFVVVVGLLMAVISLGGGLSVSAEVVGEEGEEGRQEMDKVREDGAECLRPGDQR